MLKKLEKKSLNLSCVLACWGLSALICVGKIAWAKKTNQAVYETPFDLGAGGASLTMAAKEGRIFANPALLPYGGRFHQWAGLSTTVLTSEDSVGVAQKLSKSAGGGGGSEESIDDLIAKATEAPIHVGAMNSLSWLTSHFAFSLFNRMEPDLRIDRFGDSGLPEARFTAESYHGLALGTAFKTSWRWLSFGLTSKYLIASEPEIVAATLDASTLNNLKDPTYIQTQAEHNRGLSLDGGMLIFMQGKMLDFKLAGKIDDMGTTQFAGKGELKEFKQVVSAGMGLTLHTTADALHLAFDYRDILDSYKEPLYKKVYTGVRITIRNRLGLATGIYHGHPTYGAEIDAVVMRIALSSFTREFAATPGIDSRNIVMLSASMGY